ncbi:Protein LYK5 [Vitis vinifera]|uniref:Protein LYK5 n=1 Tax=Vitis vinifera TaxID=29760 RepID=A0A438ETY1_VITVI|nr:Protein LYK5 [Vitis vinifera]
MQLHMEMEKNMNSRVYIKFGGWWWWRMRMVLLLLVWISVAQAQQSYVNNHQLDCDNNFNETNGFQCNGPRSCHSYLTFRSAPPSYDSPPSIAYLLNSEPAQIATINEVSDVDTISKDTVLIVPVNCSCSGDFYQHNTTYTLKSASETYFSLANNTYQGLTTCQALKAQNLMTIGTSRWGCICRFRSCAPAPLRIRPPPDLTTCFLISSPGAILSIQSLKSLVWMTCSPYMMPIASLLLALFTPSPPFSSRLRILPPRSKLPSLRLRHRLQKPPWSLWRRQ